MNENKIRALKVEPNKIPEVVELDNDLDSLQKAVSIGAPYQGYIEFVHAESGVALMMNEEGKLINLAPNRICANDLIVGVFYVVGDNGRGGITSLPDHKIEKYKKFFGEKSFLG